MRKAVILSIFALFAFAIAAIAGDFITALQLGGTTLAVAGIGVTLESPTQMKVKDLENKRGKAWKVIDDLKKLVETESRSMTEPEKQTYQGAAEDFDKYDGEIRDLRRAIERERRMAEIDLEREERREKGVTRDEHKENFDKTFRSWLVNGLSGITPEDRAIMADIERRALSAGTGNTGGYTVPEGFANKLEVALKYIGGMMEVATIMQTETGNTIPYPTMNDTGNVGEWLAENPGSDTNTADPSFGVVNLQAYVASSKSVIVSNLLLQDSAFDIETYLAQAFAQRIIALTNPAFTTGNGSGIPQGIVIGATASGVTSVAASAITFENLIDLFHTIDPLYRKNSMWMFNDSTVKALRKITDEQGQYIWSPAITADAPATILGKPYMINNDVAAIGASAKSVIFGDLKKYLIREVRGGNVQRLVEKYAEKNQTAFVLFKRYDGRLIDAGTHPVKYLAHSAT